MCRIEEEWQWVSTCFPKTQLPYWALWGLGCDFVLGTQVSGKEVITGWGTSNVSNKDHHAITEKRQGKFTKVCLSALLLSNQKKQLILIGKAWTSPSDILLSRRSQIQRLKSCSLFSKGSEKRSVCLWWAEWEETSGKGPERTSWGWGRILHPQGDLGYSMWTFVKTNQVMKVEAERLPGWPHLGPRNLCLCPSDDGCFTAVKLLRWWGSGEPELSL